MHKRKNGKQTEMDAWADVKHEITFNCHDNDRSTGRHVNGLLVTKKYREKLQMSDEAQKKPPIKPSQRVKADCQEL